MSIPSGEKPTWGYYSVNTDYQGISLYEDRYSGGAEFHGEVYRDDENGTLIRANWQRRCEPCYVTKDKICINPGCERIRQALEKNLNGKLRSECYRCYGASRGKWKYDDYVRPEIKKDYCENIDERLGFKCVAEIKDKCMIDRDHIDNDNSNNIPENIQYLCANCHRYKTTVIPRLAEEESDRIFWKEINELK